MNEINFDIHTLAEGVPYARIQQELEKITKNILDLSTSHKAKRTLEIKIDFEANEARTVVNAIVKVSSKLVPAVETATTMLIGEDLATGKVAMNEVKSGQPGQTYFDPEDGKLKSDIGEDISVIDFNDRKVGK